MHTLTTKLGSYRGQMVADNDIVTGAGIGGTIASIITAVAGGIWYLISRMKKSKQQDERTAIGYYRGIIDKLNQRDELREKQILDAQSSIAVLQARCNACDVDNETLWGVAERQYEQARASYDFACSLRDLLIKLGHEIPMQPREPNKLPERKSHAQAIKDADYNKRTQEQRNITLSKLDTKIKEMTDSGQNKSV